MNLTGKKLGKLTFVCKEQVDDDFPRRYKYGRVWYRVVCECGTEKLVPQGGAVGLRSCGCAQYDRNKITANETIRHMPNHVRMGSTKEQIYQDL